MDNVSTILIQFVTLSATVWASVEFAPKILASKNPLGRVSSETLAVVLGPAYGAAAWGLEWITLPVSNTGWKGAAGALFAGLLATITAGKGHDWIARPIKAKLGVGEKPDA